MALYDVKDYYFKVQRQYLEMKADLADFERALQDGHITEDQLNEVRSDIYRIEENYNRLTYILFLFELPNRKGKKERVLNNNKDLLNNLFSKNATADRIISEDYSVLEHLREEIKQLKETTRNGKDNNN